MIDDFDSSENVEETTEAKETEIETEEAADLVAEEEAENPVDEDIVTVDNDVEVDEETVADSDEEEIEY